MSRFRFTTGCPALRPLSPFHADPVARALNHWCQSEPSSLSPVGVAPDLSAPSTAPSFAVACELGCLALTIDRSGLPKLPTAKADPRCPRSPEGVREPGLTLTPMQLPAPTPTLRCSRSPEGARQPGLRWPVNTVHAPIPLSPRWRCGPGRSPSSPPRLACALRNNNQ